MTSGKKKTAGKLLDQSGDAYVRQEQTATGVRWHFGTARIEQQVQLDSGHLALVSLTDRTTGHEYVQGPSDPVAFIWNRDTLTGHSVTWVLDGVTTQRLKQGELLLQLSLHTASAAISSAAITKSYLIYPKESIVQEWLRVTNRSDRPATLADPSALTMHILQNEASKTDLTFVKANARQQTVQLDTPRIFDGYATYEYAPLQIYQHRETKHGFFVGWDYTGLWRSAVGPVGGRPVHVGFQVAHYRRTLKPGEMVETPKAFTGVFHGDLDEMGHQLLDYQYRYKWDYTRAPYFPSVSLEGYWARGGHWGDGMNPLGNYRKVFCSVDAMREIGADDFWRDHGWWDKQGVWNGPDWAETGRYLAQYGMTQTIYLPIQTATPGTDVAREHPEWISQDRMGGENEGLFFDQSRPAVLDWELKMLESKQRKWGNFEWRKDWVTTIFMHDSSGTPDSTRLLAQDQGFRHLLQTFLDRNPGMAFHGCAGGGADIGYEMLRFGVAWQFNDGGVDPAGGYYASYLFPPDKLNAIPDFFSLEVYERGMASGLPERGSWYGLLWNRVTMTSTTDEPDKLEEIRLLVDIDHYLVHQGVFGRWGFVYHPPVTGDQPERYLERASDDQRRAVIIPWTGIKTAVTIYPKGLRPNELYNVSCQRSSVTASRSGADLMAHGISFPSLPDGEVIYLNLPKHPGSLADHTPPSPPSHVTQEIVTHMDYSGVALRWQPGHDDNWVSYYQIYRNGVPIGRVAKGTYYFDHALGADLAAHYAVATVDGSGNRSKTIQASDVAPVADLVVDDTSAMLTYRGKGWQHESGLPGVANGTQARTHTPGDSVTYTFTGSRVTWYGRMGRDKGVAAVYVDGHLDRLVNTFNSDEFSNAALYSRAFPNVAQHTITIVATGVQTDTVMLGSWPGTAANAPGGRDLDQQKEALRERSWIVIDGLQVARTLPQVVQATTGTGIVYHGNGWHPDRMPLLASSVDSGHVPHPVGMRSDRAGDEATYTFTGSSVTWVGRRCSHCGRADVYLDGTLVTSVDAYDRPTAAGFPQATDPQYHVPLFTQRWTRRGRHTLKIVVRDDVNVWSQGHEMYLDALHVLP